MKGNDAKLTLEGTVTERRELQIAGKTVKVAHADMEGGYWPIVVIEFTDGSKLTLEVSGENAGMDYRIEK